jgi:hypothetical protein
MMQFYETYRGLPKLAPVMRVLSWTMVSQKFNRKASIGTALTDASRTDYPAGSEWT